MTTTRIFLLSLICACVIPGRVTAVPCGVLDCDSYYGQVGVSESSVPIYPVVSLPASFLAGNWYTTPQPILGAMVGSAFAPPNQMHVYIRNDPSNPLFTPSNYTALGNPLGEGGVTPVPVVNQTAPLALDSAASIVRVNPGAVPPQYQYSLNGLLPGTPSAGGPGTLSFLYNVPQYLIGMDVWGVDPFVIPRNPNSYLFVDFFSEDGTLIDNLTLDLSNKGSTAAGHSLWFQTVSGQKMIKGISLSNTDLRGLSYANFSYDLVPEPSTFAMLSAAIPVTMFTFRRGRRRRVRSG